MTISSVYLRADLINVKLTSLFKNAMLHHILSAEVKWRVTWSFYGLHDGSLFPLCWIMNVFTHFKCVCVCVCVSVHTYMYACAYTYMHGIHTCVPKVTVNTKVLCSFILTQFVYLLPVWLNAWLMLLILWLDLWLELQRCCYFSIVLSHIVLLDIC